MGFLYFIATDLYNKHGSRIYKIGKSYSVERPYTYGKNSSIIYLLHVENYELVEKKLIERFLNKFVLYKGFEYFIGDEIEMKKAFFDVVNPFLFPFTQANVSKYETYDIDETIQKLQSLQYRNQFDLYKFKN
jgi:hypothetical protein